jgi:hypothetical protein
MNGQGECKTVSSLRKAAANALFWLGALLLLAAQICLATCWIYAWRHGIWPFGPFDTGYRGGPWASRNPEYVPERFSGLAALLSFASVLPPLAAFSLHPRLRFLLLAGASAASSLLLAILVIVVTED